MQSTDSASSD